MGLHLTLGPEPAVTSDTQAQPLAPSPVKANRRAKKRENTIAVNLSEDPPSATSSDIQARPATPPQNAREKRKCKEPVTPLVISALEIGKDEDNTATAPPPSILEEEHTEATTIWRGIGLHLIETWLFVQPIQLYRNTTMMEVLRFLWWILKWPVTGIVTMVFVATMLVWIVAAFYTLTSNAFLSSFCEMKLPLIRNKVCYGYDSTLKQLLQEKAATDFNTEFGTIFEEKNTDTAISLPYYLSKLQTEFRWLRSNLPGARLSEWDEQFFRDTLTKSIDLNRHTVVLSQRVFTHMLGTAEFIVSGTTLMMGSLNETGFTSETQIPLENPRHNLLTIGMEWLQSKNLVLLPYGLEPFQELRGQLTINGITRIRVFVQGVIERLRKDQDGILTLRGQLDSQIDMSDRLIAEAVRYVSEETEAKVLRGYRGWYAFLDVIGHTDPKDWITQRRLQALQSMKPVYRDQSEYLSKASVQIGNVLQACENLEDSLFTQQVAVQRGMSPSDWLFEQPTVLERGRAKMMKELNVWNMRRNEVNARIFESFG